MLVKINATGKFIRDHTSPVRTLWAVIIVILLIYSHISWYIIGIVWITIELPLVIRQEYKMKHCKNY